jgi:protein-tyrosine-phosphatase
MKRILFVCTGNTCRSPMAESLLKNRNLSGVEVKSAGIFAVDGSEASPNAKKVLDEQAIKHNHQASMLTESLVNWSDYILTMTRGHKSSILSMYPESRAKVFTIKEFSAKAGSQDVSDPFGGNMEVYRETFQELQELMDKVVQRLEQEKS